MNKKDYFYDKDGVKWLSGDYVKREYVKRGLTVSQRVAFILTFFGMVSVAVGIALTAANLKTDLEFVKWIFSACVVSDVGYMGKSFLEKHSRNKNGIDEDGNFVRNNAVNSENPNENNVN